MLPKPPVIVGVVLLLFSVHGCSKLTEPRLLTDFQWGEVEVPEDVVEGVSTQVALGNLIILGQFQTPRRCYNLSADFDRSGKNLTVRVKARRNNSPTCDDTLGGFRYTASMTNLKFGTYQLKVIHDITDANGGVFTSTEEIH